MMNNPVRYTDPTGHNICDEEGNCFDRGKQVKGTRTGAKDPAGRLTEEEKKLLAVVMTIELSGWTSTLVDWTLIEMKIWVFFNLISSRSEYIIEGNHPVYNSNGEIIGVWDAYVAVMGHESGLKPILGQYKNAGKFKEWDPGSYFGQEAALLKLANSDSWKDDQFFQRIYKTVEGVETDWYQYGSGSRVDPTNGAISFADYAEPPTGGGNVMIYGPWEFEQDVWRYTTFRWWG
jgi:hypothetical protein